LIVGAEYKAALARHLQPLFPSSSSSSSQRPPPPLIPVSHTVSQPQQPQLQQQQPQQQQTQPPALLSIVNAPSYDAIQAWLRDDSNPALYAEGPNLPMPDLGDISDEDEEEEEEEEDDDDMEEGEEEEGGEEEGEEEEGGDEMVTIEDGVEYVGDGAGGRVEVDAAKVFPHIEWLNVLPGGSSVVFRG
jgi:hypothetical protein